MSSSERIVDFSSLDKEEQALIKLSIEARQKAYCPYSEFQVGAALQSFGGKTYFGCNVENAAYGESICAEKTAIVKAVSDGITDIKAIAVAAEQEDTFVAPCGSCRQVISEFAKDHDIVIYMTKIDLSKVLVTSIGQILPHGFRF